MPNGRLPKGDVTELFSDEIESEESSIPPKLGSRPIEQSTHLSLPDPLGFVEILSGGIVRDPVREAVKRLLREFRS